MNSDLPSYGERGEIYASSVLIISLFLLSGAICLLSGFVIGAYSVISDIPLTNLPTTASQTSGCFLPIIFIVIGGGLIAIGASLWRKIG